MRHLAEAGIRQFLDLGSGVPTVGHVHQIAQAVAPDARVVYVDNEPVAAACSRQLLSGVPGTAVLQVDLRNTTRVLDHPDLRALLDLDQPVAVLMFAVVHFIQDDGQAAELVAAYRRHTVPGSYLAISHACADDNPTVGQVAGRYQQTSMPFRTRTRAEVTDLFTGYDLLPPGVVYLDDWHPDATDDTQRATPAGVCGLGLRR